MQAVSRQTMSQMCVPLILTMLTLEELAVEERRPHNGNGDPGSPSWSISATRASYTETVNTEVPVHGCHIYQDSWDVASSRGTVALQLRAWQPTTRCLCCGSGENWRQVSLPTVPPLSPFQHVCATLGSNGLLTAAARQYSWTWTMRMIQEW